MVSGSFVLYTTNLPNAVDDGIVPGNGCSVVPCDGRDRSVVFIVGSIKFTAGKTQCISARELLTVKSALATFLGSGLAPNARVYFNKVPYLIHHYHGVGSLPITFVDVTNLYKFFSHPGIMNVVKLEVEKAGAEAVGITADLLKKFNAQVNGHDDLVTSYNYEDLIKMCQDTQVMLSGSDDKAVVAVDYLINENPAELKNYNASRKKVKDFDYVSSDEVKQDVESGNLWFYVPTLAQLRISNGFGFKPSFAFGNHYSSNLFRSDLYMLFVQNDWDKTEFLQYCKRTPAADGRPGNLFSGYSIDDESAFLYHDPMEVLGNSENNTLPIQSNELAIKTALTNMVKTTIVDMIEESGEEATDDRVQHLYAANVVPEFTRNYLDSLVEYFLQMNWQHTGKVPQMFEDVDSDDDNAEDGPDTFWGYSMSGAKSLDGFNPLDALQVISSELFTQARNSGVDIYIDTIIRLARWGSRKPTRIPIGGTRYMDLNSLAIDNDDGKAKVATPVLIEQKYLLKPESIIVAQGDAEFVTKEFPEFTGSRFKIPVGITCSMETDGSPITFALSIMEIMQLMTDSRCASDFVFMYSAPTPVQMFKGMSVCDGVLQIEDMGELKEDSLPFVVSNLSMKGSALKGYRTAAIKDFCLKSKINVGVSYLAALQKFIKERDTDTLESRLRFTSMAELKKKLFSGGNAFDCLQYMLFRGKWGMLLKTMKVLSSEDNVEFFREFSKVFLQEFKGDLAFLADNIVVQDNKNEEDEDTVIKQTLLENFMPMGADRFPLKDATGKVVGVISTTQKDGVSVWVISTKAADIESLTPKEKFLSVAKTKSSYLKQVLACVQKGASPKIYFVDKESMEGFVDL